MLTLVCSLSACADARGTQASGTPTTLTRTVSTTAPTTTPSGPIIPQTSAILGGSVIAFDKEFGSKNCCYDNGWTYQGPYGKMWTGVDTGNNIWNVDETSSERVLGVENSGPLISDMNVTFSQAKTICGSFIPPDAKYQESTQVNTHSLVQGFEFRYTSASLANTLPSNAFKDVDGKPTAPGTFYIFYDYGLAGPTSAIDWCRLGTDERFAQQLTY